MIIRLESIPSLITLPGERKGTKYTHLSPIFGEGMTRYKEQTEFPLRQQRS